MQSCAVENFGQNVKGSGLLQRKKIVLRSCCSLAFSSQVVSNSIYLILFMSAGLLANRAFNTSQRARLLRYYHYRYFSSNEDGSGDGGKKAGKSLMSSIFG